MAKKLELIAKNLKTAINIYNRIPLIMEPVFPEKMSGDTLVCCLRIAEDGRLIVKKGNSYYWMWKKNFYTINNKFFCLPKLTAIQSYVIENYSSKDIDLLSIEWADVAKFIHDNLENCVWLRPDDDEPDWELWSEISAGYK
jgi:hypothetical protein